MPSLEHYNTLDSLNSCSGCSSYLYCFATSKRFDDQVESEDMELADFVKVADYVEGMYSQYSYELLMSMVGKYLAKNENLSLVSKLKK
jgi:hypothetical protein